VPRAQRTRPHCQDGLEDVQHALFVCPLYSPVCARFPDLVFEPTVHAFLEQDPLLVAAFVAECQRTHAAAATAALGRERWRAPPLSNSGAHCITNCMYL
jgi:hypothetical protein